MRNDTRGGRSPREGCGLHSSRAAPSFRSAHNLPGILVVAKEEGLLSPNISLFFLDSTSMVLLPC